MLIASRNGFAVRKRSILPPGARWVEYLESTGTQHIDTGLIAASGWKIDIIFSTTAWTGNASSLFGARTSFNSVDAFSAFTSSSGIYPQYDGDISSVPGTATTLNQIYNLVMGADGAFLDGVQIKPANAATFTTPATQYLFKKNQNDGGADRPLTGRIYSCKYWNNNNLLVRDFHPIAIGTTGYMMDILTGEYLQYGNKGTGDFVIGPDKVTGGATDGKRKLIKLVRKLFSKAVFRTHALRTYMKEVAA